MKEILPNVYLVEGLRSAHVYLLTAEDGLTLIDAGTPGELGHITAQLQEEGFALPDVKAIVLTHCHADHTGNLAALAARSGAQVLAHEQEVPYIEHTASLPANSPLRRVFVWLMDRAFSSPACKVSRALQDGDVVEALGGLRVVHTPGHTPGSMVLYQPQRQVLFCGDTLFNSIPFTRKQGMQAPPRLFSVDAEQARRSAKALAELPIEAVCFGHGDPILEGAQEKLREAIKAAQGSL